MIVESIVMKRLMIGALLSVMSMLALSGCHSAQEQANASGAVAKATIQADTAKAAPAKAAVPDSTVIAGQAAFVANKCGMCHSVGAFAAAKEPAKKRELNGVGLERTEVWIASFLHKKESIDGKLHMKTFTGSDAEIVALAHWLVTQKVDPNPKKT